MKKLTEAERQERAVNALQFDHMSSEAAAEVEIQLNCSCAAYVDVFTLPRWNAQGYKIKKGTKAIRKTVYIPYQEKDANNAPTGRTKTRPKTTNVFCRCQVELFAPKQ